MNTPTSLNITEVLTNAIDCIAYYASVVGEDDQPTPAKKTISELTLMKDQLSQSAVADTTTPQSITK